MIAGWLLYCIAVSVLLAVAAAAIDGALTACGKPARWVWSIAIVAMLLLPSGTYVMQRRTPRTLPDAGEARGIDVTAKSGSTRAQMGRIESAVHPASGAALARRAPRHVWERQRVPEWARGDGVVVGLAIACILIAGVRIGADSVLLYRNRRHWTADVVDGVPVLVSDEFGPAIVGLLEPKIVLPRWTLALASDERSLMLTHELEHVRAGDGTLTTAALLAVMCMPWSPALWWSVRRLRMAIEVDCDRRVLLKFPDVARYGRLLVDVAERAVGTSLAVAGFSERAMPIARRIRAMTTAAQRHLSPRHAGIAAFGLVVAVGSLGILPPQAPARELPGYSPSTVILAKNVGDSIATGEDRVISGKATDLPAVFTLVEYSVTGPGSLPTPGRCASRLRDGRDGTTLLLRMSSTATVSVVQRGDTSWTRITSLGFFSADPVGRYGVNADQFLRVGCGAFTRINVGGRDVDPTAIGDLETNGDDRARQIAAELFALTHLTPDAVELRGQRLDVTFTDSVAAVSRINDAGRAWVQQTFALAERILGDSAMPETLTFTIRWPNLQKRTLYYYKSMQP
ncbi:MAG: M56 family metallopeptidase [bacterium]